MCRPRPLVSQVGKWPKLGCYSIPGHIDSTCKGLRANPAEKKLAKKLQPGAEAPQLTGVPAKFLGSCVAWMKLEDRLSEKSQSQKDKYHTVPLI